MTQNTKMYFAMALKSQLKSVARKRLNKTEHKFQKSVKVYDNESQWGRLEFYFKLETGKGHTVQDIELNTLLGQTQITDVADAIKKIDVILEKYGENFDGVAALNQAHKDGDVNEQQMKGLVDDAVILIDCLKHLYAAKLIPEKNS